VSTAETLERREVLSHAVPSYLSPWVPSDLPVTNPQNGQREIYVESASQELTNSGKVVSGTDRAGDTWVITVHGPGKVIVTDTTPNDGSLDDDINTIQLVGTSPTQTYVTGNVTASATNLTSGSINFNSLIDNSGVKSIELNGFILTNQITPAVTTTTGVFLYGGVKTLSFEGILQQEDTSASTAPYDIVIGNATTPLKYQPSIYLGNIQNIVYDSASTAIPTTPLTTPSVLFSVNGTIRNFSIVSTTQGPVDSAYQFEYPVVGTTGRTAIQAAAIDNLNVKGSARNFAVSKAAVPFSSDGSGLKYLKKATFGGVADGLALDVSGPIGDLTFAKGLGDPTDVFTAVSASGQLLPTTTYGSAAGAAGYPSVGDVGGTVTATTIANLSIGSANTLVQTSQNQAFIQTTSTGNATYYATPGYATTNAAITTTGSIKTVKIKGSLLNSEIKTGFDYASYVAGLEGTRAASKIKNLNLQGDLINSAISASFRPANNAYSDLTGTAGPGSITGLVSGITYNTGGVTPLGNTGAGLFARTLHIKRR
jgi:hypothetical protein